MSTPPQITESLLAESPSVAPRKIEEQEQVQGRLTIGGDTLAVRSTSDHLVPDTGNESQAASDNGLLDNHARQPRFNADQIEFATRSTGWAAGAGVSWTLGGGGVGTAVAVGAMTLLGVPAIILTAPVSIPTLLVGGLIGGVFGFGIGVFHGNKISTRRANGYLARAQRNFAAKGRSFSQGEKDNLESVHPKQWKSLLGIQSSQIGDQNLQNAVRDALIERVATGGLAAAQELKTELIEKAAMNLPGGVSNADRRKLQNAVVKMALQHGADTAQRFKQDLIQVKTRNGAAFSAFTDEELVNRFMEEDIRAQMVPLDANRALRDPRQREQLMKWVRAPLQDDGLVSPNDASGMEAVMDLIDREGQMSDHELQDAFQQLYVDHVRDNHTGLNLGQTYEKQKFLNAANNGTRQDKTNALDQAVTRYAQYWNSQGRELASWHRKNMLFPSNQDNASRARARASIAARRLDASLNYENAIEELRGFMRANPDALLDRSFWNTRLNHVGIADPANIMEHLGPQLALDVLDRATRNGTLSAKDIADFNRAIDPDGSYRQRPLTSNIAGQPVTEQVKRTMIEAIRARYTEVGSSGSVFSSGPATMDITSSDRRKLDGVFNDNDSTAQDCIAAFRELLAEKQRDSAQDIIQTLKTTFS